MNLMAIWLIEMTDTWNQEIESNLDPVRAEVWAIEYNLQERQLVSVRSETAL